MSCPCGNAEELANCCQPYIDGTKSAPTAEALMRSRYVAYATNQVEYVVKTHHEKGREDVDREAAQAWSEKATWNGLEIIETEKGGEDDTEGMVEFKANFSLDGADHSHHERSVFKKEGKDWFYVDGDMVKAKPVVRATPKVGRNEPCPCGSGKKYKRCHG